MPRHRVLTPLRWSDMDAYGHVNNVQFLRLIEDARVIAFAAAGSDEGGSVVSTGLLVARSEIEYVEPLVYRTAPVAIDLWVTGFAGASFDLQYEVRDDPEPPPSDPSTDGHRHSGGRGGGTGKPRIYARAESTLVLYDLAGHRPRRMSPAERTALEAWVDEPFVWRARKARSR